MCWLPLACYLALATNPPELPYCQLAAAKIQPGLCTLHYRVSTRSDDCQKFFDQGLGYWYSYVWTESARSFETATKRDPECAAAWWGLSRALEEWSKVRPGPYLTRRASEALKKAYALRDRANYIESQLIQAKALECGVAADSPKEAPARREAARKVIDHLLLLHPEDEEAWVARALIASEGRLFGGTQASAPFYLTLLRVNPMHPGANHELLHQYENSERPSLGWLPSERYIQSSPGIPHAWHMRGHLATRLGRWEKAAEGSLNAVALQRDFNRQWKVKPKTDHQWSHHLDTCLTILTHQGRYREAQAVYDEMKTLGFNSPDVFARFFRARRNFTALLQLAEEQRQKDKSGAAYYAALASLYQGQPTKALGEIASLDEAVKARKDDKKLQYRLQETKGLFLCQTGQVNEGLSLLQKAADASKSDYGQHAWGHGSYYLELWGLAALQSGRDAIAEEAFLEALAHDPGSFRGALGLQVLCERQGKPADTCQYQTLAEKAWQHAEVKDFLAELSFVRQMKPQATVTSAAGR